MPLGGRRTPDPAQVYAVKLADSPQFGPKTAAVTLVAAVQFPEPYTHKAWPVLAQLQAEYGKELRLVVKSYIVHPQATESSIAACAVANQKMLDAYETALWDAANPSGGSRSWPDAAASRDVARKIGVDLVRFDKDVARACRDGQARDVAMFAKLGQSAVPMFWINGRPLSGAQPIEQFRTIIETEKLKAEADRTKGGKPATYYDRVINAALKSP
ncbi:MAG: thioredoxin domain-containing protein [Deltaproteobacteria bacterium]|nr:thioredoxin domain-containing protein [Deltaproteobacteria bacterium]